MNKILVGMMTMAMFALGGCSTEVPTVQDAKDDVAATNGAEGTPITGSRIPVRRTEKMVAAVGNKDYNDALRATPAPLQVH